MKNNYGRCLLMIRHHVFYKCNTWPARRGHQPYQGGWPTAAWIGSFTLMRQLELDVCIQNYGKSYDMAGDIECLGTGVWRLSLPQWATKTMGLKE